VSGMISMRWIGCRLLGAEFRRDPFVDDARLEVVVESAAAFVGRIDWLQ